MLLIIPSAGLKSRLTKKGHYLSGAPELAFEISNSSASYDVHEKRESYRSHGVREYVVWRVRDGVVDWWELRGRSYHALPCDKHGVIHSRLFPGLWLDVKALLADSPSQVMATLQKGLASADHAAFVKQLRAQEKSSS
jgi:Uma2 family endonuclease